MGIIYSQWNNRSRKGCERMSLLLRRRMLIADSVPKIKNLMNPQNFLTAYTYLGLTVKRDGDGFTITGTATASVYIGILATPDKFVDIPESMLDKTIYVSFVQSGTHSKDTFLIGIRNPTTNKSSNTYMYSNAGSKAITIPAGYTQWLIRMEFSKDTVYDERFQIMISDTPHTEYIPYEE